MCVMFVYLCFVYLYGVFVVGLMLCFNVLILGGEFYVYVGVVSVMDLDDEVVGL